jgi:hypothetical protein
VIPARAHISRIDVPAYPFSAKSVVAAAWIACRVSCDRDGLGACFFIPTGKYINLACLVKIIFPAPKNARSSIYPER